ncbi:uncharacterized protein C1orf50 homolog [Temnothorax nylanderi]|uniref:uncharacterized protein C1orf50 homolog n=1 Tax=Temnothorax nylanderi TaxID=102681 RepID=UPI003A87CEF0
MARQVEPSYRVAKFLSKLEEEDNCIKANSCNKLQVIAEQIRFLQKQSEGILLEAERNAKLYHVACNFVKQPGHIYHLYQRESGQLYFSMLSSEEWGSLAPSQNYKGSFRLEQDRSWTPLSKLRIKNDELNLFKNLLTFRYNYKHLFTIGNVKY